LRLRTGILSLEDLKRFRWNLILLLCGGTVLGAAVTSSHLLAIVASNIQPVFDDSTAWEATVVMAVFVLSITTFVSHTGERERAAAAVAARTSLTTARSGRAHSHAGRCRHRHPDWRRGPGSAAARCLRFRLGSRRLLARTT
jgi:hypothetical protein